MVVIKCDSCGSELEVDGDIEEGAVCSCPDCDAQLDVSELIKPKPSMPVPIKQPSSNKKKSFKVHKGVGQCSSPKTLPNQKSRTSKTNAAYISTLRGNSCYAHLRSVIRGLSAVFMLSAIITHCIWFVVSLKAEVYGIAVGAVFALFGSLVVIYAIYQAICVYIDIGDALIDMGNNRS